MTDNFLQKLEEKVMSLLTELEGLRKEVNHLRQENSSLKVEKLHYMNKLQSLVSLLDSMEETEASVKTPELEVVQVEEEYATA